MANFEAINFGGFNDVSIGYWADDYIYAIYQVGVTLGCGGGNYCPTSTVTRDQMAAFLVRAKEGEPPTDYCLSGSPFVDVPVDSGFCKYIKRLSELGITQGTAPVIYSPLGNVTRDQMAAFIIRAVEGEPDPNYCAGGSLFGDVPPDSLFCKYIKRLSELGITQGTAPGIYNPLGSVTRDQMAAFLARAFLGMQ
jgi:Fe2+ transport system protein FeoA